MKAIGEGFADGEAVEATEECEKVERRTVCCHCAAAAAALRRTASRRRRPVRCDRGRPSPPRSLQREIRSRQGDGDDRRWFYRQPRSEEQTTELQSLMRHSTGVLCLNK